MKRHQQYLLLLVVLVVVYVYVYHAVTTTPQSALMMYLQHHLHVQPSLALFWVQAFPFYLLISLGCYCLWKLGVDLLMFKDCPEDIPKLAKEIEQVREDLKRRGFKAPN